MTAEESLTDLLWNNEPAFYMNWHGWMLLILIGAFFAWGIWQDIHRP